VSEYSLTTGLLGNMFLFGDTNTDRQLAQLLQYNWIHSTQTNMSLANAREYFENPICLPQGDQSGKYLERLDVINSVILPPDHPIRLYSISKHLQSFKSFFMAWEQHQLSDSTLRSPKGFLHLQYLSLCVRLHFGKSCSVLPMMVHRCNC
jgi:hypothetical protein